MLIQVLQTGGLSAGEQQIFLPDQFVLIAFDVCMLYIVNFKISMLTNEIMSWMYESCWLLLYFDLHILY